MNLFVNKMQTWVDLGTVSDKLTYLIDKELVWSVISKSDGTWFCIKAAL